MLNGPIKEVLVLVQLEEHEQVEVDFHPHLESSETRVGNLSRKLEEEEEEGTIAESDLQAKDGTPAKLGSQAKIFSSNLTSF